jgi:molybdopterin/thiamine biosynthesis adenylyltransferase
MQRYWQQIMVPEMGLEGQQKLKNAKVLIAGAGGLGTPVATYLAAAGVGLIGIIDGDVISISNLHRQFHYCEKESGLPKSSVLAKRLIEQNPEVKVDVIESYIDDSNAESIISNYDVVCDCTDNSSARIMINRACRSADRPLVYAAVKGWEGYITVLHHAKKKSLENIFSIQELDDTMLQNCVNSGIINTTCGICGCIQANEALKIIVGIHSELDGSILCFHSLGPVFKTFALQ